jgi:hypothetical protein
MWKMMQGEVSGVEKRIVVCPLIPSNSLRMRQSGHWQNENRLSFQVTRQLLTEAIDSLDLRQAKKDIRPFIRNPEEIEIWSRDFLHSLINRIRAGSDLNS